MEAKTNPFVAAQAKLAEAERLRLARKRGDAKKICEALIKQYPDYVGALHTLGLILAEVGNLEAALPNFVKASMLDPKDWKALTALSSVYLKLGSEVMAIEALEQAQKYNPNNSNIYCALGNIYQSEGEYELALDAFQRAIDLEPGLDVARIGLADCLAQLGNYTEAADIYKSFVMNGGRSAAIMYQLAGLCRVVPGLKTDKRLNLSASIDQAVPRFNEDAAQFGAFCAFAKAAFLDAKGQYDEAWDFMTKANAYLHPKKNQEYAKLREAQKNFLMALNRDNSDHSERSVVPDCPQSLFILGPSRSGKTTLEKMLRSLDGVKVGYENNLIERAVRRTFQSTGFPTRELMVEVPTALSEQCRQFYIQELGDRGFTGKVISSTNPGRIQSVLRIAEVIPNAKFIFIKRDIDELTLRIYMKFYASGNSYAYSIRNIRDYISWYYQIIDLAADKLSDVSLFVTYKDLIQNPESVLSAAAELCGLGGEVGQIQQPYDDSGCAAPYEDHLRKAGLSDVR